MTFIRFFRLSLKSLLRLLIIHYKIILACCMRWIWIRILITLIILIVLVVKIIIFLYSVWLLSFGLLLIFNLIVVMESLILFAVFGRIRFFSVMIRWTIRWSGNLIRELLLHEFRNKRGLFFWLSLLTILLLILLLLL